MPFTQDKLLAVVHFIIMYVRVQEIVYYRAQQFVRRAYSLH